MIILDDERTEVWKALTLFLFRRLLLLKLSSANQILKIYLKMLSYFRKLMHQGIKEQIF